MSSSRSIATLRPARVRSMRDARVTCARGSSIRTCKRQKSNDEDNDDDDDDDDEGERRWKDVVLDRSRKDGDKCLHNKCVSRARQSATKVRNAWPCEPCNESPRKKRCHQTGFSRGLSVQSGFFPLRIVRKPFLPRVEY